MIEQLTSNILKREIAKELLLQNSVELSDETFDLIFEVARDNPWDCVMVYEMLKITGRIAWSKERRCFEIIERTVTL